VFVAPWGGQVITYLRVGVSDQANGMGTVLIDTDFFLIKRYRQKTEKVARVQSAFDAKRFASAMLWIFKRGAAQEQNVRV
jgi:hypothetical protein